MADDQSKEKPKPATRRPTGEVFDVRRPGKALAPPTSRPIITGHKPEAQAAQTAVSGVGEASPILTRRKIQIMPSGDIDVVETKPAKSEPAPAEAAEQKADAREVPEKDKEALASAALDAVTGPPELQEEAPGETPAADREDRPALFTKPKLTIEPPKEESKPAAEAAEEPEKSAAEDKQESSEESPAPEKAEAEEKTEESEQPAAETAEEKPASSAPEASASAEGSQDKPAEGAEQEEQKPEPHIDPLFDDHGALVSRRDHQRRHHGLKVALLLFLILVLAAVALDILLDLEILNVEDIPHTDFL